MTLALCVLTTDYEPAMSWDPEPPEAPPAEAVEALGIGHGAPPIFEQLETRPVWGAMPFSGGDEAIAGGWLRAPGDTEMSAELVSLYTDAWWPAPFSVMSSFAPAPTLELTIHFRPGRTPPTPWPSSASAPRPRSTGCSTSRARSGTATAGCSLSRGSSPC